ncbi:MAG: hypothetical protein FWE23_08970 [Chitinivibrionia bacterium]|nr:hypothetical protein [Chitinivibrionia bacterium]
MQKVKKVEENSPYFPSGENISDLMASLDTLTKKMRVCGMQKFDKDIIAINGKTKRIKITFSY